jgi:hypothetical protein
MRSRLSLALLAQLTLLLACAAHAQDPHSLLEKAIAADKDPSAKMRYTYFELSRNQTSYKEHVLFGTIQALLRCNKLYSLHALSRRGTISAALMRSKHLYWAPNPLGAC